MDGPVEAAPNELDHHLFPEGAGPAAGPDHRHRAGLEHAGEGRAAGRVRRLGHPLSNPCLASGVLASGPATWLGMTGRSSWLAGATTAWPAPPTWPAVASGSWSWSDGRRWAAPPSPR